MHAVEPLHSPTPEEIMEYVDGEGAPSSREAIAAHLAGCAMCRAIAAEQRALSDHARAWTVSAAPASLQSPVQPPAKTRLLAFSRAWQSRAAMIAFSAVAAGLVLFTMRVGEFKRRSIAPLAAPSQPMYVTAGKAQADGTARPVATPPGAV